MDARTQELHGRSQRDPYNQVSVHPVEGGVTIVLSHRITMDAAVQVFVADGDVLFFERDEDQEALETLNKGGDWPRRKS